MLAICSAPLHVRLHPVKSTVLMLLEYFTLWQMTEIYGKWESHAHIQCNPSKAFGKNTTYNIYLPSKPSSEIGQLARDRFSKETLFEKP